MTIICFKITCNMAGVNYATWKIIVSCEIQSSPSVSGESQAPCEVGKTSTSSLLMAEGRHIHQTPSEDNEDSLLKHRGIYKRIKSFPFFQPNFLFPVVCSFPILQTQDYSFFTEKKIKDIHMCGRLRFETINTHSFSKYIQLPHHHFEYHQQNVC